MMLLVLAALLSTSKAECLTRFSGSLGALNGVSAKTYDFCIAKVIGTSNNYATEMVKACAAVNMKPVCDHPSYCKTDSNAIYIGQTYHIAYPPHRNVNSYFPSGWASVKDRWNGLCSYTKAVNGATALCNIPSNTHAWRTPNQVNPGFVCAREAQKCQATYQCQKLGRGYCSGGFCTEGRNVGRLIREADRFMGEADRFMGEADRFFEVGPSRDSKSRNENLIKFCKSDYRCGPDRIQELGYADFNDCVRDCWFKNN